jgi:mycothiol synthase
VADFEVLVAHRVGAAEIAEIRTLLDVVSSADGHPPLAEHKWIDLAGGGRRGFLALLCRDDAGHLAGYAQLTGDDGAWGVEVAVHPARRAGPADLTATLLGAAVGQVRRAGGGRLRYWAAKPTQREERAAASLGFAPDRDLLQLRVPLPLDESVRRGAGPPAVRPFRPGQDEAAWLAVNNRAFADHPEQGGWDLATLQDRERQDWFDPAGFLLLEEGGRLVGSCWTKVHRDADPPLGEIYVISVDPDFHGRGLGRALTVAGLDHLAASGITTGMLYVDADNRAGTALYRSLGFTRDHLDRAFLLEVTGEG